MAIPLFFQDGGRHAAATSERQGELKRARARERELENEISAFSAISAIFREARGFFA